LSDSFLFALESHNHIVGDIERGVKLFERGGIEHMKDETFGYVADIPENGERRRVAVNFTADGRDVESFYCKKCSSHDPDAICCHVVAVILDIQGGVSGSKLTLGKSATASAVVNGDNTVKAVGSGSLDVFVFP